MFYAYARVTENKFQTLWFDEIWTHNIVTLRLCKLCNNNRNIFCMSTFKSTFCMCNTFKFIEQSVKVVDSFSAIHLNVPMYLHSFCNLFCFVSINNCCTCQLVAASSIKCYLVTGMLRVVQYHRRVINFCTSPNSNTI